MTDLKPCPFCGSGDILLEHYSYGTQCTCQSCWTSGPADEGGDAAWNSLPRQSDIDELKQRLALAEARALALEEQK